MAHVPESLERRREAWRCAINEGDAEAFEALVTDDAVWIPASPPSVNGREAIRTWLDSLFGRYAYGFRTLSDEVRVRGDRAIETGLFVTRQSRNGTDERREHRGSYTLLWRRDGDGEWRIERYVDDTGLRSGLR